MTADGAPVRALVVDPSAYTRPMTTRCAPRWRGLARRCSSSPAGSPTAKCPTPDGYDVRELFYRRARGAAGSRARRLSKLASHVDDMRALRRLAARAADVVHFQWLAMPWLDAGLLPDGPLVLTAHDLLPREPRPGQARAQLRLLRRVSGHRPLAIRPRAAGLPTQPTRGQGPRDPPRRARARRGRSAGAPAGGAGRRDRAGRPVLRAGAPVQGRRHAAGRLARHHRRRAVGRRPADDRHGAAALPPRRAASGSWTGTYPSTRSRPTFVAPT